jgi:hypothetical protein
MKKYLWALVVLIILIIACNQNNGFDPFDTSGSTSTSTGEESGEEDSATATTTGATTWTTTSVGDEESTESGSTMPPPDVMIDEDLCESIDFLFVIDNSGSMNDEQMSLVASFPGFISGIDSYLTTLQSYHVGIVTTDAYAGNSPGCDQLGGLVTSTVMATCGPYIDGHNFMTENDDLLATFPCAAEVGTSGSGIEQPLAAIINALENYIQSPGQCNEGFTTPNSLLVLIIISDEPDFSGGTLQNWYDHLMWLRGPQENIVVLSLVTTTNCTQGYGVSTNIIDFTNMFTNGSVGDVCALNYDQFFYDALSVIYEACYMMPPID